MKKLIVFDLDGTLAESKSSLDAEMAKLLKAFGLIPGAVAAYGMKRMYQGWRQKKAMNGWPSTSARVLNGQVHKENRRYWVELTYSYYVEEYRSGKYVRKFRREEEADDFVRQVSDRQVQIRYNQNKPDESVILDRDLEMIAALTPQFR